MNSFKRVSKNLGVFFISQIVNYILSFFFLVYTARYLGVENFGILSLALAFTGLFSIISDLGLSTLIVREVARKKSNAKNYLGNALILKILFSMITLVLIVIFVNLLKYNAEVSQIIYLIAFSTILISFYGIFNSIFQAFEKMKYQSIGIILSSLFLLLGGLTAIYLQLSLFSFALLYVVVSFLIFLYSMLICFSIFVVPSSKFDFNFSRKIFKESLPFAITITSVNLYTWIDTILLSIIIGEAAVGWYTASYKLILTLLIIPVAVKYAIFPVMSRHSITSKKALKNSFEKVLKAMVFLGIPLGIGIFLLSDEIILLIYGNDYLNSVIILQILVWSSVLIFLRSPFERLFESVNNQLLVTKCFLIGVFFNIVANLIFIPIYSYVGAAIITILTDLIVLLLLLIYFHRLKFNFSQKIKIDISKILILSLCYGVLFFGLVKLNIIFAATFSTLFYLVAALKLKIIDEDELKLLRSILASE